MFGSTTFGSAPFGASYAAPVAVAPPAAPTGVITAQPPPDGQSQQFSGVTTNATSGIYTLTLSGGGTVGPAAFAILDDAFDFSVTNLAPGNYTPVLTVTGPGGTVGVSGLNSFEIIGISGSPEGPPPSTQGPVFSGAISISAVSTTGYRADWPAATDADGVTEYKYRLDGGSLISTGTDRFKVFSTLSPDTDYTLEVFAYDQYANPTAAPLSIDVHTDAIAPVVATGITLTGPTSGDVGLASTTFTLGVTPVGSAIPGTVRITPASTVTGDTFIPAYRDVNDDTPTGTFTVTPATVGARTISATNDSGLTDPAGITYTAAAVAVPDTSGLAVSLVDAAATLRLDSDVLAAVTPQLASMIRAITQEAEHEVGRVFITRTVKQAFGGFPRHGEEIQLDIAPAISVESVEYRNGQGAWQTVDPQTYEMEEDSVPALIALLDGYCWPSAQVRKKAVRVNFTAGYGPTSATVPACAQQYILLRLAEIWDPAAREFKMTAASEFAPRLLDSLRVY